MAKADDTTSTIDWIWLREALALAAAALGSVVLAKRRLMEWLAAGKLPWSCMSWKGRCGRHSEGGSETQGRVHHPHYPIGRVSRWRPQVLGWPIRLQIDWEEQYGTRAGTGGAKAWGSRCRVRTSSRCCPKSHASTRRRRGRPSQRTGRLGQNQNMIGIQSRPTVIGCSS